jgi:hypothetical protein
LKVKYILVIVLVIVVASYLLYPLLLPKKLAVTFSDGKILTSDGKGPYISKSDGVRVVQDLGMFIFQAYDSPTRPVSIRFADAPWKDWNLSNMPSLLPSANYRVILTFGSRSVTSTQMDVGQSTSPFIWLTLYDADTGKMYPDVIMRDAVPFGNASLPSQPPLWLYGQGYATLTRQSQDVWVLDADAWFTEFNASGLPPNFTGIPNVPKHYVRLSLTMTINLKALWGWKMNKVTALMCIVFMMGSILISLGWLFAYSGLFSVSPETPGGRLAIYSPLSLMVLSQNPNSLAPSEAYDGHALRSIQIPQ